MIFELPRGTQKSLKIHDPLGTKWSWKPSGGHFGRFTAFYSILDPFWIHSGPLLDLFLADLVRFCYIFLMSSCLLCFLFDSVFFGICGGSGGLVLLVMLVFFVGGWVD